MEVESNPDNPVHGAAATAQKQLWSLEFEIAKENNYRKQIVKKGNMTF